jgi:hypothetical protein
MPLPTPRILRKLVLHLFPLYPIVLPPLQAIHNTNSRPPIHTPILPTRPLLALALPVRPSLIPLPVRQQIIQPENRQRPQCQT